MTKPDLKVGRTYFRLTFADPGMTMPGVEPIVYIGDGDPDGDETPHIFQDTISYSRFGSRLDQSHNHDEMLIYFVSPSEVGCAIVDVQQVAQEVAAAAQRAATLGNPTLLVLRDGWKDLT